jgi:2Fe-2S ferredoxin
VTEILVLPANRSFTVREDQTLLEAATAAGWIWPSVCGGQAACGTCAFTVEEGDEALTPIEPREQARLNGLPARRMLLDGRWRLACQTRTGGDARLTIRKNCTPPAE